VDLLGGVVAWLANPVHWQGSDGIPTRVGEHLVLSGTAVVVAAALALPLGVLLGHLGRGGFWAMNVANVGRALPSMALLAFALWLALSVDLGLGFWPTFFAMVPLGIPPMLTNSYVGIRAVDGDVVDAARGMGLSEWQILRAVELPLAAPLIIAGVRSAAVAVIATATLGAIVASGGLGRYIVDGLARQDYERLVVGALLVALLAVAVEAALGALERALSAPGAPGPAEQAVAGPPR
jgi:osmoprotectant transport system permease protein